MTKKSEKSNSNRQDWIPERLKKLTKTQSALAVELGVGHARIAEIVNGKRLVKSSELLVLASFLEISIEDIVLLLNNIIDLTVDIDEQKIGSHIEVGNNTIYKNNIKDRRNFFTK